MDAAVFPCQTLPAQQPQPRIVLMACDGRVAGFCRARQRSLGKAAAACTAQWSWDAIIGCFEHVLPQLAQPSFEPANAMPEGASAARTG